MKKIIIPSLFLVFVAFPSIAPAQTFSVEQEVQMKTIIQQITDLQIQLLLARIAELQTMIADLIAKQVTTEQTLGAVQTQVDTVVTQTTPTIQAPIPENTVTADFSCENGEVRVNATVSNDSSAGYFYHWATTTPNGARVNGSGTIWKKDAIHPNGLSYLLKPEFFYWITGVPTTAANPETDLQGKKSGTFDGTICKL